MKKIEINKGDRYGNLIILSEIFGKNRRYFKCKCVCGSITDVLLNNIRRGNIISCGCAKNTHGMSNTRIYGIWEGVKARCNNPNRTRYNRYGGRGITYDPRWEKFENFYEDMKEGYSDNLTIDRKENDGNYCKDNCAWATDKQQRYNKSNTMYYNGKEVKILCKELGIKYSTVYTRIHRGATIQNALKL